jgi:hypothetical protein
MSATTRMHRVLFFTVVPIFWALLGVAMPCHADFMLRVDNLATQDVDVFVIDQVSVLGELSLLGGMVPNTNTANTSDLYAEQGAVGFSGSVGGFSMSVTLGMSQPLLGAEGRMDLFNVSFSGGTGTLVVELWDTDFETQGDGTRFQTLVGGTTDGLLEIGTYADSSAAAFGTEYYLGGGTFDGEFDSESTFNGIAFAEDVATNISTNSLSGAYSMGIRASITHTTGMEVSSFNVDLQSSAVPEPSAAVLAVMVLLALACCRFRRRRNG